MQVVISFLQPRVSFCLIFVNLSPVLSAPTGVPCRYCRCRQSYASCNLPATEDFILQRSANVGKPVSCPLCLWVYTQHIGCQACRQGKDEAGRVQCESQVQTAVFIHPRGCDMSIGPLDLTTHIWLSQSVKENANLSLDQPRSQAPLPGNEATLDCFARFQPWRKSVFLWLKLLVTRIQHAH